jgi:UPF0755 protein
MAIRKRFVILICLGGLGLLLAGVGIGALVTAWFHPFRNYTEPEKLLWIAPGTPSPAIARQLEAEGIVSHHTLFLAYAKTLKWSKPLQAGEYLFREPLTIPQVAERLNQGLIHYRKLTIPEGTSLFEIPELFREGGLTLPEDFDRVLEEVELISDLSPSARNLEGFLFPDTYRWTRQTTARDLIRQMVERFRQVVAAHIQPGMESSGLTLQQVVTLASLVETETGMESERALVSSVFHNRLGRGIPLQCDPTVIYAAKLNGRFRGKIYQSDLDFSSPYNTYTIAGLPPGPIANPGLKSLQAAIRPATTDYLYFVSDNRGGHVFSETLSQHLRAVGAYRRALRSRQRLARTRRAGS